jgi:hypothetical protein
VVSLFISSVVEIVVVDYRIRTPGVRLTVTQPRVTEQRISVSFRFLQVHDVDRCSDKPPSTQGADMNLDEAVSV